MPDSLSDFFSSKEFMPHGHCLLWKPGLLWLHIGSDAVIALSYYSIPLALAYFVQHRSDLTYKWVFRLFSVFIFWCGTTHLMSIWVIWNPGYWADGIIKAITAGVSAVTAILLWPLIPKALTIPSPETLRAKNRELVNEVWERERAQRELQNMNENLEHWVETRTGELMRTNAELEQFVYVVSHDLREPLRAIVSYTQLLERDHSARLDSAALEYFGYITGGAKRMNELIADLLAYARAGRAQTDPVEVNLEEIIGKVKLNLKVAIEESGTRIGHTGNLPAVCFDPVLLTQVFQNLVSNAIKYRRHGQAPAVHISATETTDEWSISVADNGVGIPPDQQDRVFALFYRGSPTAAQGTGLGLAITKKIVERFNGRIWVETVPEGGAAFRFTIPKSVRQEA